jgi:hypothetical protein
MSFHEPEPVDFAEPEDPLEGLIGRRSAPRVTLRVPARFRLAGRAADVIVIDISASGARLHAPGPPPAGPDGVLSWEGIDCPCRIVWSGKDSFGVVFREAPQALQDLASVVGKPVDAAPPAIALSACPGANPWAVQAPPATRRAIQKPAEVRQGETWIKVVLKGISQHGFEVGWFPRCKDQAPIWLRGPGLPVLQGRVTASDQLTVKCKLRAPLHEAVLQHISAQLGINL